MRDLTRIMLKFALIALSIWGFLQSCSWLGEMNEDYMRHNGYPYYGKYPYKAKSNYNIREETQYLEEIHEF